MERKNNIILKFIAEAKGPVGSKEIATYFKTLGIEMSERTVRYHLKMLNDQGLLKVFWKEGRMLTKKGQEEIENGMVLEKIGLVSSKIEALCYQMDFNLAERKGRVILNISFIHKNEFGQAVKIMREVFLKKMSMGKKMLIIKGGEEIGGSLVPKGKIGVGTLCAINLNAMLLKESIPVESKFGGVLQIENNCPHRFTDLINYSASTLDPHEIFIRSKMTSVREAAKGSGKILAGLREIPMAALEKAKEIVAKVETIGLGNLLYLGKPEQPVLGMPVGIGRVGLVIPGGLNPIAAVEEWGIETESKALSALIDYNKLVDFSAV